VFTALLEAPAPAEPPRLTEVPAPVPPTGIGARERAEVARARAYRLVIDGREHRLLRGDLHRHTEISWDGNGDGSIIDAFRYAIDAAAMDFLEVTDHNQNTGPDDPYVWWRTQKVTEAFNNPPAFVGLFGYERSLSFPNGHRNIISDHRLPAVFPFTRRPEGGVAPDDTKQLYAWARQNRTIVISHTSGTRMGTDWRDNDPLIEPVVEIFQGARTSYEYEGAPKSASPGDRAAENSGYEPEGFVWRAWEKGLLLGVIASSDHGSTHISYASVYAREPSRLAILEGLRRRHTFGATDNLIVDVRVANRFMGDVFRSSTPPRLQVRLRGTDRLTRVDVIKDLRFVYTRDPQTQDFDFEWTDAEFTPGRHMYYVRAQQADGQIAWGSPVWVER
ncbi:MAG: hypothetical protein QHJ73_06020, partial [Armatimonadota bacterium]|nr:hypothetical protein [Armatimonadota bacterium]